MDSFLQIKSRGIQGLSSYELSIELLNKEKAKYRKLQLQWFRIAQEEGVGSLNYSLQEARLRECSKWVNIYRNQLHSATIRKFLADKIYKFTKPLPNFFKKKLPLAKYLAYIADGVIVIRDFAELYSSIPRPCKDDEPGADKCRTDAIKAAVWCEGAVVVKVGLNALLDMATIGQLAAAIPSGGVSAVTGVCTFIVNLVGSWLIDKGYDAYVGNKKADIIFAREGLQCKKPQPPIPPLPPCPPVPPIHDPSGFVYEGVASNRIEGVTATAYYKDMVEDMYGDLHENIVKWDAEEYAQENPLFTDEYGMYAWDVPQGLWQVKFEKEGYETTYSEWLPVPPPQLDVNIAMKQNVQPNVKAARAYEDAVEVEFDKYMMSELLTAENIIVMQNGMAVDGTVELLNEEPAGWRAGTGPAPTTKEDETFASKIRFNAAEPFTEQEITLMVNNRVKSYAGIRMQDNYEQTFNVEQEIKRIVCDSLLAVGYGKTGTMTVSVLPASASKGKVLTAKTSSPMILGVETKQITIGNDGKAEITVSGELPGTAALTFKVEGTDKEGLTIVSVEANKTVAMPTASIASGSVIEKGTAIMLSCETEGATIYYTLDGSCPCVESDARKVYDGTPIVINETVTIKAMAMAPDMYESEVAEFSYIVDVSGIDDITVNEKIHIYPLPVHDILNISAGGKAIKNVTVSSMNGVVVTSVDKPATIVKLYVGTIPTGIYIVNIHTEDSIYSRKILKVE